MLWQDKFDASAAYWEDYRPLINALPQNHFPDCHSLNQLIPKHVCSAAGQPIRFVSSSELDVGNYEQRIFKQGYVSTRDESWHDLFNALVWLRFPRIKTAMNALHYRADPGVSGRGRLRDALTLFDECGVLVVSSQPAFLKELASRDWPQVFQSQAIAWDNDTKTTICGHAMLEKLLTPYKSMTAKALLVQVSAQAMALSRDQLLGLLDRVIAEQLMAGHVLNEPAQLSPLPLAGIPGWDFAGLQNAGFYDDADVFRQPPDGFSPAPILILEI